MVKSELKPVEMIEQILARKLRRPDAHSAGLRARLALLATTLMTQRAAT